MFLGIDLGTSEVKTILLAENGEIVASARSPLRLSMPKPGWSEQNADDWWEAAVASIDQIKEKYPKELAASRAIGLSGQMHGATLLDKADRPLRPAILWNDTRSHLECEDLMNVAPKAAKVFEITGNLAMPGFTAPKLLWVAKHEPEIFAKVASVLLPKDYLRLKLTGEKVSEMSDAAGTLWLDVGKRAWSDTMLEATKLSRSHMPRLIEGSEVSGHLKTELASRWGMSNQVVVAGGGGDNAASAVGIGAVAPGSGFISLGTSGVVFVVNDRFLPNPARAVHAFCHALPGRWHQMSVMLSAASCLQWVTKLTGYANEGEAIASMERYCAENPAAIANSPIFLPYLSGERTPHNDPAAQGVFFGLRQSTEKPALIYSVIEGVAFGLTDGVDALRAAGTEIGTLSLVGGGSRSAFWAQLIADLFKAPLQIHSGSEAGAALGAARLGQLAFAGKGADEAKICAQPKVTATFTPSKKSEALNAERLGRFRDLYKALAPVWKMGKK